jgi:HlyD family secretion protein
MNPDLKVYRTEIALEVNDPQLRTGMNCRAEIIVEQDTDAVYVPLQTVVRVGGQPTVYVLHEDGGLEGRPVELGLDDNNRVRIVRGLGEDERVLLTPPVKPGAVASGPRRARIRGTRDNEWTQKIREKLQAAGGPPPTVGPLSRGGPGHNGTQ